MEDRSPTIGFPEIFYQGLLVALFPFLKSTLFRISLRQTFSLELFGNSIPTVLLPGIAVLADSELVFWQYHQINL